MKPWYNILRPNRIYFCNFVICVLMVMVVMFW
jgi:hypothetical protein